MRASLFVFGLFFANASAFAALKANRPAPTESAVLDVSVPMARGELQAEVAAEQSQRERANAPRTQLELAASSWKPASLQAASRIRGASAFSAQGLPALEASLFSPLVARQLWMQVGVNFLRVQRSGNLAGAGQSETLDQNAYLAGVRLGAAFIPGSFLGDRLSPYVSAAALPTLFVTRRSAFDDGVSQTGIPFEAGAGALLRLFRSVSLDLGASETFGRVQDSDLTGFALRAGLRMPI